MGYLKMSDHSKETSAGQRFEFGKNWKRFLSILNEAHINEAEESLCEMLEYKDLKGMRLLDIGSGSGLFSLASRRLGARVLSFDFDPQSVACTLELKNRYFPGDHNWIIEENSVLDETYLKSLGTFDIVYSWGVLHHTGNMFKALHNAQIPVEDNGLLFIAIYNDQGFISKFWRKVKRLHCSGLPGKIITILIFYPYFFSKGMAAGIAKFKNPIRYFTDYKQRRGMSVLHDWKDWLGGYPFEVARPEEILGFYQKRGFVLRKMTTTRRNGNNQFVFKKVKP